MSGTAACLSGCQVPCQHSCLLSRTQALLWRSKSKLYRFDKEGSSSGEWKERGVGQVRPTGHRQGYQRACGRTPAERAARLLSTAVGCRLHAVLVGGKER